MSPREVCFLIGPQDTILWSDASTSPVALPDSRERWETIWRLRGELVEIAHSHPVGPHQFSREDETTMIALTQGLGRALQFSVVSPSGMLRRNEEGREAEVENEPWWAELLRAASRMNPTEEGRHGDPEHHLQRPVG